jgi:uncharacterized protein YgfB (UPF0149 family)
LSLQERHHFLQGEAGLLHLPKSEVGHETFENDLLQLQDDLIQLGYDEDEDEEEVEEKDEKGGFCDDDNISLTASNLI